MAKANYVGANRGDITYIPPPSSAMSSTPTTGYAQQAQYVGPNQIHAVDSNRHKFTPAPGYEKGTDEQVEHINSNHSEYIKEEHVENRPNIIIRLWRHYKRHWKLYLILTIIFLAILLPVFFLVAFPAIAQLMVDKADLPIYAAQIMEPTPRSVVYSMNGSLDVPKPFSVRMEPVTLSLFIDEGLPQFNPYVEVGLFYPDGKTLKGNATVEIANQKADIKDSAEFVRFLESAVYNEKFFLSARGETTAWLGKLKAKLKLNKKVELKGLNMLKGFAINSARVVLPPEEDGTNFIANITLPNASDVTFEMGNVTLNLKVAGLIIGHATILDVFLVPGNNSVTARGTANLRTIIANLPLILAAEAQAISKGNIELQASGNKTVYKGEGIYYFDDVLNKLELSASMPILKLLLDSAGGLLGDLGGPGGIGGLLGGLSGGTAGQNLSETLKTKNITDLIPLLLGPETEDNSNGNSSLLRLLGMRAVNGFQKRNTIPTILNIPVTLAKSADYIARRSSLSSARSLEHVFVRTTRKVQRYSEGDNAAALVSLLRSEKHNIAAWVGETFNNPEAGSIADSIINKLLEGRSRTVAKLKQKREAVGVPLKKRQNIKPQSHADVAAAILAKERGRRSISEAPIFDKLAYIRGVARNGVRGIAGNAVSAEAVLYKRSRNTKSGREIVDSILVKRKALELSVATVNSFGRRSISNLRAGDIELDAAKIEALKEAAKRRENPKPVGLSTRSEAHAFFKGRAFAKIELLGRFAVSCSGIAKRGISTIQGSGAEAASAPPPLHKRRNLKNHREVVAAILSKREALNRFGKTARGLSLKVINDLKTRELKLDTSKLHAVKEVARRQEDARRAALDTRSDRPVVVRGRAFQKGELLGKFALVARNFAKHAVGMIQGGGAEAVSVPPPLHKRRNQKNHGEVVAAILSKREALDRFGRTVRSFGMKGINSLKTRKFNLDTSKFHALQGIARRQEDARRAALDTRSETPVIVKERAFQKGELLGKFALAARKFAKRTIDTIEGRAVTAASTPPPLEKRRKQKNNREVVAAILSKREALDRFGAAIRSLGFKTIQNLKTRDLNFDISRLEDVKEISKRREDAKRAALDTTSESTVFVKGRAFQKGELLGRFALTARSFAKRTIDTIRGRTVAAETLKTPAEFDGEEDLFDDIEELEIEEVDDKILKPIEELPNPLAAFGNIGALLQQRNTLALLGNVAALLAKDSGLKKRDLSDQDGKGSNGGAEAAAAVALGLTDVHKVMPLLMTNAKALEAFGKLTGDRDVRAAWAKLSESEEAKGIWKSFVKGREEADAATGKGGVKT